MIAKWNRVLLSLNILKVLCRRSARRAVIRIACFSSQNDFNLAVTQKHSTTPKPDDVQVGPVDRNAIHAKCERRFSSNRASTVEFAETA